MTEPRSIYSGLLEERRAASAECVRRHRLLGYARLATLAAGVAVVVLALGWHALSVLWVFLPIAVFAALLIVHNQTLQTLELCRRAEKYFVRAISRLDGEWAGAGERGERYTDPAHPYAADLDLFGPASLFELLSTARTHIGEDTLAHWLLSPAESATVLARQQAVDELRPRIDLREELAVVAEQARTSVDPVSLAAWGESPSPLSPSLGARLWLFTAFGILGLAALFLMLAQMAGVLSLAEPVAWIPRDLFLLVILSNSFFLHRVRRSIEPVAGAVEAAAHELRLFSDILCRLEREQFRSPLLTALRQSLDSEGEPPSRRLARLNRLMEHLDSRDNVFVRILEPFLMWTAHIAVRIERWRGHSGAAVRRWLNATGEIEALCSLASYAFENPSDPFPEFTESGPVLEGESVGHPLIPVARVVRNDVSLGNGLQVLVVSGSNMSGKSTLLRTLGINVVLAQAGAPVRAARLRLSPLAVGASIRVNDSLQGGVSRFYAEITRLRQILDLAAGPLPLLFLIDEFLHGTNSHDRRIGAEALVRGFVQRGAIGLITTHDLALADIAEQLGTRARNVHFEDRVEDGRIHFDYRMRPGVVTRSNAIELMRSVGLEI
jgi:hypothetical protein